MNTSSALRKEKDHMKEQKLSEKPPISTNIAMAMQHVVAMVVGCVTVPFVLGGTGLISDSELLILIQMALFSAAVSILLQTYGKFRIGSGLPIIVGSGFAFMPTLITVLNQGGLPMMFGSMLVGSIAAIFVGIFYKKIKFLFPPIITAIVVMTLGISLYPTAVKYMAGGAGSETFGSPQNWAVGLFTLACTLFFGNFCKGALKVSATLAGLCCGYVMALVMNMVDFSQVATASLLSFPKVLPFGMAFSLTAIIPTVIIFVINAVQDMGQIEAITAGVYDRSATDEEISGGIIANNLSSLIGSFIGGVPQATAGQNTGIIITTKITDKIVYIIAALVILLSAVIPKISAVFLTIPYPVLGGATVAVFGSIAMTGMRMISNIGLTQRNLSIAGLSIAIAIGISQSGDVFALCSPWVKNIFGNSVIVVVAIVAILLNIILPKE